MKVLKGIKRRIRKRGTRSERRRIVEVASSRVRRGEWSRGSGRIDGEGVRVVRDR